MTRLLLVNPWIFDFAACDFWLKPIGLLALANALKQAGFEIQMVDLTDTPPDTDPKIKFRDRRRPDGRGRILAEVIPRPPALKNIPRRYKRYGVPLQIAEEIFRGLPEPDAILLGTTMTYWSFGYIETVRFLRGIFKKVPIIAGGLYATVCNEHARSHLGADFLCSGDYEQNLPPILQKIFGAAPVLKGPEEVGLALDLYPRLEYGIELTGRGCPFRCRYCVGWKLHPQLRRKPVEMVVEEIKWQAQSLGLKNIAFYDDALILDPENHIMPVLEKIARQNLGLKFHIPNGIHLKPMTKELAQLMKAAGFETIRFGLETADVKRQRHLGYKACLDDLEAALGHLEHAGYSRKEIGVYLLAGLPGQTASEVEQDLCAVKKLGARPSLSEYSPIPGTDLWEESLKTARYPFADEPLLQNCSLLPCAHESLPPEKFYQLERLCRA